MRRDILLTDANLQKRNWPCGSTCVLCSAPTIEDADHLFLTCPYACRIWNDILPNNMSTPGEISEFFSFLHSVSKTTEQLVTHTAITCWNIWKERNIRIFQSKSIPSDRLFIMIMTDVQLWNTALSTRQNNTN
jgi:zinc-binding in reverse transcriptase